MPPGLFVSIDCYSIRIIWYCRVKTSFLGGLVLWGVSGDYRAVALVAAWGFFLWASEYGDFRCRKTLPLTEVVARLRRLWVHCGERYGSFLFFKRLLSRTRVEMAESYLRVIRTTFSTWWVWGNMSTGCTSSTR